MLDCVMRPVVYVIQFPSGKLYVGATNNFPERRRTHLRHARKGKAVNKLLQAEFAKYPICAIYELEVGASRETLHELEQEYIDALGPELNVLNIPNRLPAPNEGKPRPWGPYASLAEAARKTGLTYKVVKYLARRPYDQELLEGRVTKPPKKRRPPKLVGPPDPHKNKYLQLVEGTWDWPRNHRRREGIAKNLRWTKEHSKPIGPYPSMSAACRDTGLNHATLLLRLRAGWTDEEALFTPPGGRRATSRKSYHCAEHPHDHEGGLGKIPGPSAVARSPDLERLDPRRSRRSGAPTSSARETEVDQ